MAVAVAAVVAIFNLPHSPAIVGITFVIHVGVIVAVLLEPDSSSCKSLEQKLILGRCSGCSTNGQHRHRLQSSDEQSSFCPLQFKILQYRMKQYELRFL